MSDQPKSAMLTIKITLARLEEFRISAMLRGTTMSRLIAEFIDAVVDEEKSAVPEAFRRRSTYGEEFLKPTDPSKN